MERDDTFGSPIDQPPFQILRLGTTKQDLRICILGIEDGIKLRAAAVEMRFNKLVHFKLHLLGLRPARSEDSDSLVGRYFLDEVFQSRDKIVDAIVVDALLLSVVRGHVGPLHFSVYG